MTSSSSAGVGSRLMATLTTDIGPAAAAGGGGFIIETETIANISRHRDTDILYNSVTYI